MPELNIPAVKAKVDTGARTSALHASDITLVTRPSGDWVRYTVRPIRKRPEIAIRCESKLIDRRPIKNSGGHVESRYIIETKVLLGDIGWPVSLSLTCREDMIFRMLLGRTALTDRVIIHPAEKYLTGKVSINKLYSDVE